MFNVHTWDDLFQRAGAQYAGGTGLDPGSLAALAKAHAVVESGFDPQAFRMESGGRASRGLMQVLDTTARALGYTGSLGNDGTKTGGLYDPAVSIPLATRLVAQNLAGAGQDVNTAIAAYNEGLARARQDAATGSLWRTSDPRYVQKVRAAFDAYAADFVAEVLPGSGVTPRATGLPWWWLLAAGGGAAVLWYFLR